MRRALFACLVCACSDVSVEEYAVTRELYPTTVKIAVDDDGVDLDGDQFHDNRIGIVLASLYVTGLEPGAGVQALIDRGDLVQRIDVRATDTEVVGADPIEPVTLGFFDHVVTLDLVAPRVRVDSYDGTTLAGSIAGGVRRADVDAILPAPLAGRLEQIVASQCLQRTVPGCGCTAAGEYDARYWLDAFDASGDCTITADEIVASSLAHDALFSDVTLEGEPLLSFGLRFEATPR